MRLFSIAGMTTLLGPILSILLLDTKCEWARMLLKCWKWILNLTCIVKFIIMYICDDLKIMLSYVLASEPYRPQTSSFLIASISCVCV